MFLFNVTDATGAISGLPSVRVYDSRGRLKGMGGTPVSGVTSVGLSMPSPVNPAFTVSNSPVTSTGVLTVTANGTASQYIDGTGALQTFPTGYIYTVDNGLTENPAGNFQLGGTLIQDTDIDGVSNAYRLNLIDLYESINTARYAFSFTTNHGGNDAVLDANSLAGYTKISYTNTTTTNFTSIELSDTLMKVQTPLFAAKSVGDVLTLSDPLTGEVEFQTPTVSTPGLQDVIINDPVLTQNNNIDGGNFNLNFNNNNQFNVISDQFITLTSDNGTTDTAAVEINTQGAEPFVDIQVKNGVDTIGITVDTSAIFLRTPGIDGGTALLGDVLTLIDPLSGEAEFQTPTGGTSSLPYGLATQSPAGVYTATIAGVTSLTAGDVFIIKFDSENENGSTLNINSLGAIDIFKNTDVKIASGDIKTNQTVELVYDGTNFQAIGLISSQLVAYVHNAEGAVITKGQVVYAYQASGDKMSVKLARADSDATSAKTIGLVYDSSIGIGGEGYIIIQGVIEGINTAAFSAGNTLYLSGTTFGGLTNVKPYAPTHLVYVGIVERANAGNGQIYVRCQNGYELDEIHDVDLITNPPVNNDVLVFDTSTTPDLWVAKSIPTILGYTPANINSPAFTGSPTAPTAPSGTNTTQIATTAFVQTAVQQSSSLVGVFGDGGSGNATITGSISLTNDAYYNDLTVSGVGSIFLNGFRLFVKGTLDISNAGALAIHNNGFAGDDAVSVGAGTNTASGTVGRGGYGVTTSGWHSGGTGSNVAYRGGNGGAGASANTNNAAAGLQSPASTQAVAGGFGGSGGKGGNSAVGSGALGGAGQTTSASPSVIYVRTFVNDLGRIQTIRQSTAAITTVTTPAAGAYHGGGGGGAASSTASLAGGGGAGGGGGGNTIVYARQIVVGAGTNAEAIASRGGRGGNVTYTPAANVAGAGGAGGGGGGYIYLVYGTITGGSYTFASANGGVGGNGGNGSGTGLGGQGGSGGSGGRITAISLGANTITVVDGTTNLGTTPAIPVTITGSAGGAGGTCTFSS